MAKATSLDEQLTQLRTLREKPIEAVTDEELSRLVASKFSNIAAAGAGMAAAGGRAELPLKLVAAFERFERSGARNDKGCLAKLAIVNALCALDHRESDVYLRGLRIRQVEASWGKPVDSAGELRGRCAEALVGCLHPNALIEIASLLADDEPQARVGAVRAAAIAPGEGGAALLRLKLATGDAELVVLVECCAGLLRVDAEFHAAFVAGFLEPAGRDPAQAATEAFSECRSPAALRALRDVYERAQTAEARKSVLEIVARMRVDGAPEFLLELVEKGLHPRAREVVECLPARKDDPRFLQRLAEALERRDDAFLTRFCAEAMSRTA